MVNGKIRQGDMALYYGLTPQFTYQDDVAFCKEFNQRLKQIVDQIVNTNVVRIIMNWSKSHFQQCLN